jgi:hypothetical protein
MGIVRPFQVDDIEAVADLFWKVFKHKHTPSPLSLRDCFRTLYFSHPFSDAPMGSLTYEDEQGKVRGFIGGMPLRLRYRDESIWALVAGNHMVDPDMTDPMAGAMLLRRLFAGPQDLTYSDTANGISVKLWQLLGARPLLSNSVQWIRVLRPSLLALELLRRHRLGKVFSFLSFPFCSITDVVGARLLNRSIDKVVAPLNQRELEADTMLRSLGQFAKGRVLLPDYDRESLNWRLSLAGSKKECGPLVKTGVYEDDRLLGWYLAYMRKGAIAEVLQLVANEKTIHSVLNHLFSSALQRGCVAVMGSLDSEFLEEYSEDNCFSFIRRPVTVAHSRDPAIMHDISQGKAFLSRLEGEWWSRLQGDEFV